MVKRRLISHRTTMSNIWYHLHQDRKMVLNSKMPPWSIT